MNEAPAINAIRDSHPLLRRYEKGIVSFAEQDDCLLMWSHYGDQHRGICIGYSVPERAAGDVHKVEYGRGRLVRASDVAAMLDGEDEARARVDESVLLRKAESWPYEQEWRLIGRRETQNSPLELEEIIFGMKCKESAKYAVMKALEDRSGVVEFYEMREERGTFNPCLSALRIHPLGVDCVRKMASGSILHVGCVCINRIGTVQSKEI